MPASHHAIVGRISAGDDLATAEMFDVVSDIMRGEWTEDDLALLLNALRLKGETVDEITGAAQALRQCMTPIRSRHPRLLDTCGTGGTGSATFNISTAAAIVTAAAGVPVAKHGNRSITSKSGSADVLAELGVNLTASTAAIERCLNEAGVCFCFAPQLHPAMKHVAGARKKLGVRTIFNILGPLCNPASAQRQVLGTGRPELRATLAEVLRKLGTERSIVVSGPDGLGEVSLAGVTAVSLVTPDQITELTWRAEDFGVAPAAHDALLVAGPAASAALIRAVLQGQDGPPRRIVILNAAAALWTAGIAESLPECAQAAAQAIDCGAARQTLSYLVELSHTP